MIGNPPYQGEAIGKRAEPLYHIFLDEAYKVSDKVVLVHPGRFLFGVGQTPKSWNRKMLNDEHLKVLMYEQNSEKVFPGTDIKGGIAVTYRDSGKDFGAIKVFSAFPELNSILGKVSHSDFTSLNTILYGFNSYKITEAVYQDNPAFEDRIVSPQTRLYMLTNIFDRYKEIFSNYRINEDDVCILGRDGTKRAEKFIKRRYVNNHPNLDSYKVIVPGSNGSGALGEVLSTPVIGTPVIGTPGMGHTQTFISFGVFSEAEANSCIKYIKTKFMRAMLGVKKITQHNENGEVWAYVPLQDFTPASDIDWAKPIPEIDRQLYAKYGLDESEIEFIESHVKEMS